MKGWVIPMKRRKKLMTVAYIILIVFAISCIPIKQTYKDGGTISYNAILYSYTKYHQLQADDTYYEATELLIFPFNFLR